jgi:hypothetical protein
MEQSERHEGEAEERETSTVFDTPMLSSMPPIQAATVKAEQPVLTKRSSPSMLPRPTHAASAAAPPAAPLAVRHALSTASTSASMAPKHEVGKSSSASNIARQQTVKHESTKHTSSQTGHGRKNTAVYAYDGRRLPGKPSNMRPLW